MSPAPQAEAGPVPYPRGRALGGSGAINAMAHVRGHRAVYDGWAAGGAAGLGVRGPAAVLPAQRARRSGRDPALRGTGGPVRVAPVPEAGPAPGRARVRRGAARGSAARSPMTSAARRQEGVAWVDLAIARRGAGQPGRRLPAAGPGPPEPDRHDRLPGHPPARSATAGAPASSYLRDGSAGQARASGEVIVCAGAVGSPQLLLLSGIGPAAQLRDLRHRPGGRPARGRAATSKTTRSSWPATPPRRRCRPAGTTTARCTRRCAARWPATARTCTCSPSCCRSPRPGASPRPAGSPWWPPWSPRQPGHASGSRPPTRRRPR